MKFRLFSCCIPVQGQSRSILVDIQRKQYVFIDNEIYTFFNKKKLFSQKVFENKFSSKLFHSLLDNEFIHEAAHNLEFSDLNVEFSAPEILNNAIVEIDLNNFNFNFYEKLFTELEYLGTIQVQLRLFNLTKKNFENLLKIVNHKMISFEIYLKYQEFLTRNYFNKIIAFHNNISFVFLHSVIDIEEDEIININNVNIYRTKKMENFNNCGFVNKHFFVTETLFFIESQKHNTCLNRKISLDVNGNIKNCPAMTNNYGNFKNTNLIEAIEKPGFMDMWFIHKDQIEVCKDCEFRHICTDCRAYIQDPNNIYSKPAKCSYDPYTATWGDENPTNNPLYGQ